MYGSEVMMIYHYTTVETLEKILRDKTLMFNCLLNVDDKEEGVTSDYYSLAKHFFVSCWTDDSLENITLWNMYSKGFQGVRIGIESEAIQFKTEQGSYIITNVIGIEKIKVFSLGGNKVYKINYSKNEENAIFVKRNEKRHPVLNFDNVFTLKRKEWSPQKECRFVLFAAETENNSRIGILNEIAKTAQRNINRGKSDDTQFLNSIFLDISEIDFSSFSVVLGPKLSKKKKEHCRELVKKYMSEYNIPVEESVLTGNIRKRKNIFKKGA